MLRILCSLLLLTACSTATPDIRDSRFIMGTIVEFTIAGSSEADAEQAINAAAAEMQRIEHLFTIYGDQENPVKAFNRSPVGTPVVLDAEISRLIAVSLQIQRQSQGAFHPGLAELNRLWGFSQPVTPAEPPAGKAIQALIPPSRCFEKQGDAWLRLDDRCQFDFGAIAKGYAIDRGIEVLRGFGITNAIINAGGDIRVIGRHGDQPWRIGIRHPRNQSDVVEAIDLEGDMAVVTSGDYERFYLFDGKRYHHILNPVSGRPATACQSATVMAESAMLADALSTALLITGSDNEWIKNLNYRYLTIDKNGVITKNLNAE